MLFLSFIFPQKSATFPHFSHSTFATSSFAQESSSLAACGDKARKFSPATEDGSHNANFKKMDLIKLSEERNINVTISLADLKAFLVDIAETERTKELADKAKSKEVEMVSREYATEYLGVTYCTLWRWEKSKYLVPTRTGKAVYYRKDELRAIKEGTR